MKDIKEFSAKIILTYLNLIFIFKVMEIAFKISNFSYILFSFLFVMVIAQVYVFKFIIKKIYAKVLLILFIICITVFFAYNNMDYINELMMKNNSYMQYLNDAIYNREATEFFQYKILIITLLPIIIFISIISSNAFPNFIIFFNFVCITFFWYYGYTSIINDYLYLFILLIIITFSINNFLKERKVLNQRGIKTDISIIKTTIYVLLLSLIIVSLQSFLPKNFKGHYKEVKDNITNRFLPDKNAKSHVYNISSSGYPDTDSKLGGPITLDNKEVFKVKSNRPYYLRGRSKDFYNGFSWRNSIDTFKKIGDKNPLPKVQGGRSFFIKTESAARELTIYPSNFYTTTVFSPVYISGISIANKNLYMNKEGDFLSSDILNAPYSIGFYDDRGVYSNLFHEAKSSRALENMDFEYKRSYLEGEMENYKDYLKLPENIPRRVYDLTSKITAKDKNISERLVSIYNYLNKNYKYSLQVSEIPKDREFVDYFLFEEKKGYCTYFATSSVVMLRMAGIPARYVEGFNMTNTKDEKGLYIVTNKNAHAWVEVLLSPAYNTWAIFDAVPSAPEILRTEHEEAEENEDDEMVQREQEIDKPQREPEAQLEENKEQINEENLDINKILLALVGLILIISIILLTKKSRKNKIIKSQSIIPLYQYILKRLKIEGIIVPSNMGDLEFWKNYEDVYIRFIMRDLCSLVYAEYYGQYNDLKEIDKMDYYNSIEKYLKDKQNKIKYVFFYYLIL